MKQIQHFTGLICLLVIVAAFCIQPVFAKASNTVTAEYNLSDGAQDISYHDTAKFNFTMTESGYATISSNGEMSIQLFQEDGTCIYENAGIIAKESEYAATFSLVQGSYYALVKNYGNDTISVKGSITYEDYQLSSTNTKCYAVPGQDYYLKVKVKKAGVIKVTSTHSYAYSDPDVYLCDSKKKELSTKTYGNAESGVSVYAFGVTKGTYYIKLTESSTCAYALKYSFISVSDQNGKALRGGSSKKKAITIKMGKTVKGLFLTADKAPKEQWYKFVVNNKKVTITIKGNASASGDMRVIQQINCELMGPQIISANYGFANVGFSQESNFALLNGTYYFCLTKSGDKTSGSYSINIK